MAVLVLIDTAISTASVCIAKDRVIIDEVVNTSQKDHAAWLHPAVLEILSKNGSSLSEIDGFAISAGPGSYTGLRVGMSAVKGLCYALNKPMITINTLKMMAAGVMPPPETLLCPMIDARRMEVFTAIYNGDLQEIMPPGNLILNEESFKDVLEKGRILFFGNGSDKFKNVVKHANAAFADYKTSAAAMMQMAFSAYEKQQFADLAYSEPWYGKAYYLPSVKPLI